MASTQRIKGQEVEIVALVDGQPYDNVTTAKDFDFGFKTEILQEGYLGETTDRYDTIYKGVRGKVNFNFADPTIFTLIGVIISIAQRRTPGSVVNIKAVLNFPNGRRARIVVPSCEFGELPVNFGSRAAYGAFALDFAASDARVLVS